MELASKGAALDLHKGTAVAAADATAAAEAAEAAAAGFVNPTPITSSCYLREDNSPKGYRGKRGRSYRMCW